MQGDGESRRPIAPSVLETLAESPRPAPPAAPEEQDRRAPRPAPAERRNAAWFGRSTALATALASLALCWASWTFLGEVRQQRRLMDAILRTATAPEIAFVAPTGFDPDAPNRLTLTVHNEGGPAEEIELDAMVL